MLRGIILKRNAKKAIVFAALSAILGASSLGNVSSASTVFSDFRYVLSGAGVIILFLAGFRTPHIRRIPRRARFLLLIWVAFAVLTFASGIFNNDTHVLSEAMRYAAVSLFLFIISVPRMLMAEPSKSLAVAMLVGGIPYLIWSVLTQPIVYPYSGVFSNPNAMGVLATTLASAALTLLSGTLNRGNPWRAFVHLALVAVLVGFIMLSGSRTSLVAFLLMFVVMLLRLIQRGQWASVLFRLMVPTVLVGSVALVAFGEALAFFWTGIIGKIERYAGNPFSGRLQIWHKVFEDMALLGNGSDYFLSEVGKGAHNSVIGVLGRTGYLTAGLVVIFAMLSLLHAYKYARKDQSHDRYKDGPLIILVGFWTLSMAESLLAPLGQGITVATFVAIGIAVLHGSSRQPCDGAGKLNRPRASVELPLVTQTGFCSPSRLQHSSCSGAGPIWTG